MRGERRKKQHRQNFGENREIFEFLLRRVMPTVVHMDVTDPQE